jgi:hypothetical protein
MTKRKVIGGSTPHITSIDATAPDFQDLSELMDSCGGSAGMEPDEVPAGWFTSVQMATGRGTSLSGSRTMLNNLYTEGKIERAKFRVRTASGSVRSVYHYKKKKKQG